MEDIRAIEALFALVEAKGLADRIRSLRAGALQLDLEPPKPAPTPPAASLDSPEAADAERRDLEALLWSSGADVTPFLRES